MSHNVPIMIPAVFRIRLNARWFLYLEAFFLLSNHELLIAFLLLNNPDKKKKRPQVGASLFNL